MVPHIVINFNHSARQSRLAKRFCKQSVNYIPVYAMTKISLHEVRKFPAKIFCYEFPASGAAGYFPTLLSAYRSTLIKIGSSR
jgi:hypothetical protein